VWASRWFCNIYTFGAKNIKLLNKFVPKKIGTNFFPENGACFWYCWKAPAQVGFNGSDFVSFRS